MRTLLWDIAGDGYSDLALAVTVASATSELYCHELAFASDSDGAKASAKYAMSRGLRCFFESGSGGLKPSDFGLGIMSREYRKLKKPGPRLRVQVLSPDPEDKVVALLRQDQAPDVDILCEPGHRPGFSHTILPQADVVIRAPDTGPVTGLAVVEAMAVGAVVCVPDSGVDTEYVRHGRNGYVYSDPEDLRGMVFGVAEDRRRGGGLRAKLAANAMLTASWRDWRLMRQSWIAKIEEYL